MGMGTNKKLVAYRLDPYLLVWLDEYARSRQVSKTAVIESLLIALREGRLREAPRAGPNAFPGEEEVEAGSTSEYPVLVAGIGHMGTETQDTTTET